MAAQPGAQLGDERMTRGGSKPNARRTLRANEASLDSYIKTSRARNAGQAGWVTPNSAERVRELVDAQICPVCGDGPFKVVAMHTNRCHGIGRYELRELCGVSKTASITAPAIHAGYVARGHAHGLRMRDDEERMEAWRGQRAAEMAQYTEDALAAWRDTDGSWAALEQLADSLGKRRSSFRGFLQKHGCAVPDGRAETRNRRTNYPERIWRACTVEGCDRRYMARGLCNMHYARMLREEKR
jgi:hypothetical protein